MLRSIRPKRAVSLPLARTIASSAAERIARRSCEVRPADRTDPGPPLWFGDFLGLPPCPPQDRLLSGDGLERVLDDEHAEG